MPPAARLTDMHTCPMVTGVVPHVGGPITSPGCPTVIIGGLPAARIGDIVTCVGPPDTIIKGSPTVIIGGMPAARLGDNTAHGGVIVVGHPTTMIGESGSGGGGGGGGGGAGGGGTSETGTSSSAPAQMTLGGGSGGTCEPTAIEHPEVAAECTNPACSEAFSDAAENGTPLVDRNTAGCGGTPIQAVDTGTHWLEIQLVGEDDNGIVNEPFIVKLPNGEEVTGNLGPKGDARIEGIERPGPCMLKFPRLDRDAWQEWTPLSPGSS